MIRREARLRREYLYRKSLEDQRAKILEKQEKFSDVLEGKTKRLPTELKRGNEQLLEDFAFDEGAKATSHIDDEYANAGIIDPKILITTSRDPSSRLSQFSKELRLVFPNSQRINRGNFVLKDIVQAAKNNDCSDVIIVHEHRGVPDGLIVCHLPFGPTAYFSLANVVLRHDIPDIGPASEAFPHLIFDNFSAKLGLRLKNILKHLFPVPKEDSKRVITFSNDKDYVSFRHHVYKKIGKQVELQEVGPRFEMKLYEIRLGTVDIDEADKEWVYRPFLNTAKKRQFISAE